MRRGGVRRVIGRIALASLLIMVSAGLCSALVLWHRAGEEARGRAAFDEAGERGVTVAYAHEPAPQGRFTTEIAYTALDAGTRELYAPVVWDDAWFGGAADATATADAAAAAATGDDTTSTQMFNPELGHTASILAALAYSESGHYQAATQGPAYLEQAFRALGFSEVSTESYRYRSEIVDQVIDLVQGERGGIAYGIARKRVTDADGQPRSVIAVTLRGSYGAEWLSNLEILLDQGALARDDAVEAAASTDAASAQEDVYHHPGYAAAAERVATELARWVEACHADGDRVSILLTGHSRGGAVANLMAARALDELVGVDGAGDLGLAEGDEVLAYTFATPRLTTSADAHSARYASIVNVVNPADIVPRLPLESWGFERYGQDLVLPSATDDAAQAAMDQAFRARMGSDAPSTAHVEHTVVNLVGVLARCLGCVGDIYTPDRLAALAPEFVGTDLLSLLNGHFPSVYIAWMEALGA